MTAFVLGNGTSRRYVDVDQLTKTGHVYGCNALYRTHTPRVLVATDTLIAGAIQESGYALDNRFYTRRPIPGSGALEVPDKYRGCSSGPIAVSLAALDDHNVIYLLGFDLGGLPNNKFNNIYADTEFYKKSSEKSTYSGNWIRQLCRIIGDFPKIQFIRVEGDTSAEVTDFDNYKNFNKMSMPEFIERINKTKDL